jgi:pimeloyl-ACP methyl ester carboxylesterase
MGRKEEAHNHALQALANMRRLMPAPGSPMLWTNLSTASNTACQTARFEECEALAREAIQTLGPNPAPADLRFNAATPVEDWWAAGNHVPMLVIQGLDDVIAPPGNGRVLRDRFGARVTLIDIPHAGHALLFEQPERIASEATACLKAHP